MQSGITIMVVYLVRGELATRMSILPRVIIFGWFPCLTFLILPLAKFSNIIDLTALTLLDENWVWAEWWHHRFTQSCFI